jgi:hypothetical protein
MDKRVHMAACQKDFTYKSSQWLALANPCPKLQKNHLSGTPAYVLHMFPGTFIAALFVIVKMQK